MFFNAYGNIVLRFWPGCLAEVLSLRLVGMAPELLGGIGVCLSSQGSSARGVHANNLSDEQLVELWQQGDRYAFELLVQRYQSLAYTVCCRYLVNPQIAEETAQDVFVSLFRKLDHFRGDASFKSWFYRVLVNHCHNRHKARVRRKRHLHDSIDVTDSNDERQRPRDLVDERPDPEAELEARREQALIEAALKRMGEEARMVLLLREGQGMAYEEISDLLRVRVGTVKSRIHRARAELKNEVERLTRAGV